MDTNTAPEITETSFKVYIPGSGRSMKRFNATSRQELDRKVRAWLRRLDDDVRIDWPADYDLPEVP